MSVDDTAKWAGAIATFIAVIVALLKEEIIRLWRKPDLVARVKLCAPDCHKTRVTFLNHITRQPDVVDCYYFRLWVENKGNLRAEKVQVFASKLLKKHTDGVYREEQHFLPMNLKWSHSQIPIGRPEIFADGISPEMGKHCDLGHINHPSKRPLLGEDLPGLRQTSTVLALDLEVSPNTLSHLIPPGEYRLEIKLAATNSKPVIKIIEMDIKGNWYDNENEMFSKGIDMKEMSGG